MENLSQIVHIKKKLKTASKPVILALHRIVFQQDGDRGNRQRLREFQGFDFDIDFDEFRAKMDYAVTLGIGDLISICNVLGLEYVGTKEQLREKIILGLMDINSLIVVNDDGDDDDQNDAEQNEENGPNERNGLNEGNVPNKRNGINDRNDLHDVNNANDDRFVRDEQMERELSDAGVSERNLGRSNSQVKFMFGYKDVEDSIRPFNGSDSYPVERFIVDFEDAATMFGWGDLQKVVFAKKSLKGLAKLFMQTESSVKSWNKFKTVLLEEFSTKISSAQLHKMMECRKIKKDESVYEYFLTMKELAGRGSIDNEALFEYTIDGINDDVSNKAVLFGAKSVKEFKEKLKVYEVI